MIFRGLEVGVARDLEQLRRFMRDGVFAMTWTTDPPTQPGTYWFKREPTSRAVMMDVRETDGALTVFFAVTAYNTSNLESAFSPVVSKALAPVLMPMHFP
jgi:hypothetical protein